MRKNLAIVTSSILLLFGTVLAQTQSSLRERYGPADEKGRYIVRPGIGMRVQVDETGVSRDVEIRPIEPNTNSADRKSTKALVMNSDLAQEILAEVAPSAKSGRYKSTGNAEFGCYSVDHVEYENAMISITNRCHQQGEGTVSVRIHWKK